MASPTCFVIRQKKSGRLVSRSVLGLSLQPPSKAAYSFVTLEKAQHWFSRPVLGLSANEYEIAEISRQSIGIFQ
jgi:hypothetical protein